MRLISAHLRYKMVKYRRFRKGLCLAEMSYFCAILALNEPKMGSYWAILAEILVFVKLAIILYFALKVPILTIIAPKWGNIGHIWHYFGHN